jgi:hypothetical protein
MPLWFELCNHLGSTTVFRTWPRIRRVCGDPGAAPNFVREMGLRLRITSLTSNYDYDRIFDGRTIKGGIWIKSIKVYTVKMD